MTWRVRAYDHTGAHQWSRLTDDEGELAAILAAWHDAPGFNGDTVTVQEHAIAPPAWRMVHQLERG